MTHLDDDGGHCFPCSRFREQSLAGVGGQALSASRTISTVVEMLYDAIYVGTATQGQRDALGRITKKTESIVSGDTPIAGARPLISRTYDYGYNADGRPWLESVAVNDAVISAYSYDDNGNRTSAELDWSQSGYSAEFDGSLDESDTDYNDADQLLTYGSREYTWNAFGQLESMRDTATQGETLYTYDLYGNLLTVALPDGRTIEYDVDGAGRRVGRRVLDAQGVELESRGWIYRDLLRPIAEVDAAGNVTARYVYLDGEGSRQNGMHQLATRLGANQDTSLPFAGSNVPEFVEILDTSGAVAQRLRLIVNQVGTVQAAVDVATGEVVQRIEHDEFGRVLFDSNPGVQPFGFAGGLYDPDSRLTRLGARDYSGDVGRWNARDPVRFAGGTPNHFEYAWNDPVNFKDVLGTITQLEHCERNKLNRCPYDEPSQNECGGNNRQDFEYTGGLGEENTAVRMVRSARTTTMVTFSRTTAHTVTTTRRIPIPGSTFATM
jgi:RHS repeat-associated protein